MNLVFSPSKLRGRNPTPHWANWAVAGSTVLCRTGQDGAHRDLPFVALHSVEVSVKLF